MAANQLVQARIDGAVKERRRVGLLSAGRLVVGADVMCPGRLVPWVDLHPPRFLAAGGTLPNMRHVVVVVLAVLLVLAGCATAPPAVGATDAPAVQSGPPVWLLVALVGIAALLAVAAVQVAAAGALS